MNAQVKEALDMLANVVAEGNEWLENNPRNRQVVILDNRDAALRVLGYDKTSNQTSYNMGGTGITATGFTTEQALDLIKRWNIEGGKTVDRREFVSAHVKMMSEMVEQIKTNNTAA